MYTLNAADIDNGGEFFRKLNANFAEVSNPQSSHTDRECLARFVQEMNKKAALLGMANTTFYDPVGLQPLGSLTYDQSEYPDAYVSADANTMTAMDAMIVCVMAAYS